MNFFTVRFAERNQGTMKRYTYIFLLSLIAALGSVGLAQDPGPHPPFVSSPRRILVPPELLDAPDEWIDRSLKWVESILEQYPPGIPEIPVRRAALIRLDDILHIQSAPTKPLVQEYYRMRMEQIGRAHV